jgi:paraquat-inducible protein A
MNPETSYLQCPLCGQSHRPPFLKPGQRVVCVRCGATLAERGFLGYSATLAFAVTGLVLFIPSLLLPFVTLMKLGKEQTVILSDGAEGLWTHGFGPLAGLVLFCGILAPLGLLTLLVAVLWTDTRVNPGEWNATFRRWAHGVEHWAMPEVQILGVMVAFFKLDAVVEVSVRPGLWCYSVASLFTLLAWRRFSLQPPKEQGRPALAPASA